MNIELITSIIYNATFLIAIAIMYSFLPMSNEKSKMYYKILIGIPLSILLFLVMNNQIILTSGIVLDTRSILISLTALFFGLIPAMMTVTTGIVLRAVQGGAGAPVGILVILSSGVIGYIYRRFRFKFFNSPIKHKYLEFYFFGLLVHVVMMILFLFLPGDNTELINGVSLPVLLFYPIVSLGIAILLNIKSESRLYYKDIIEAQKTFTTALKGAPVGMALFAEDGTIIFLNEKWVQNSGYAQNEIPTCFEWIEKVSVTNRETTKENISKLFKGEIETYDTDLVVHKKDGTITTWDFHASRIGHLPDGRELAVGIGIDISERIKLQEKLTYFSFRDDLTGLYNRRFYEEELTRLNVSRNYPFSLLLCDVNALKLQNDAFGHQYGDMLLKEVSDALRRACRSEDIIARIGGDEFVVILSNTPRETAEEVMNRVNQQLVGRSINDIPISVAMGTHTSKDKNVDINRVYRIAEENMYQNKLLTSMQIKEDTINIILDRLFAEDEYTKIHSIETSKYAKELAVAIGLDDQRVKIIEQAGYLHDIGKIVMPHSILKKESELDEIEYIEILKHAETGYRILSNGRNLSNVAAIVLEHHEKWDGSGYPQKKTGNDILEGARIVSIADAYSAMTTQRCYRKKPLSKEEAIEELRKSQGRQFDPKFIDIFIEKVIK